MPEMPDMPEFLGKLQELRDSVDAETIQAIMAAVPPALVRDVLAIVMDPNVQRGLAQVQEAVANAQDISFDLFESLPAAVQSLRDSLNEASEGLQTAAFGIDTQRIAALKAHLPAVAGSIAKVALARPEAEPLRANVAQMISKLGGAAYDGQPGAATVAVALSAKKLMAMDRSRLGNFGQVVDLGFELLLPAPYIKAVDTVIAELAKANNIDVEYEQAAWTADAGNRTLITGAVNRYARAHGLDAIPAADRLAATQKMTKALERLFEGVAGDWVANGSTEKTMANATRNARTALKAIDGMATAAVAAHAKPTPPAKKTTARKPTTRKGPAAGAGGPEIG